MLKIVAMWLAHGSAFGALAGSVILEHHARCVRGADRVDVLAVPGVVVVRDDPRQVAHQARSYHVRRLTGPELVQH